MSVGFWYITSGNWRALFRGVCTLLFTNLLSICFVNISNSVLIVSGSVWSVCSLIACLLKTVKRMYDVLALM